MIQIHLDGSGKSDDPHCRFLTLAGVLAEEAVWNEWAERWRQVLGDYGVEYSHMKELFQKSKGPFQAWNHERRRKFVMALLQTADSEGWRSAFRTDVDHDSEVMPISIPN